MVLYMIRERHSEGTRYNVRSRRHRRDKNERHIANSSSGKMTTLKTRRKLSAEQKFF